MSSSRLRLFIVLLVGFVDHFGLGLVYPIFAAMLFDSSSSILPIGTSAAMKGAALGLLMGLTPLVQFISCPIFGALSDKYGRRKLLLFGISFGILGYVIAVMGVVFGNIWLLLVYRALVGLSDGTASVANAAIADLSSEEEKSRHFGYFGAALGLGFTMGPFIGGILSDPATASWCGYATPFVFSGILASINWVLVAIAFPESNQQRREVTLRWNESYYFLKKAFVLKGFRIIYLTFFLYSFGWAFYSEFIPVYLLDQFAFSSSHIGDFYAYQGLWYAMCSGFLCAPFLKRYSPEKVISVSLLGTGLYLSLFLLIENPVYIWVFAPALLFFVALSYPTATALVSNRAPKDSQGEILGIYHALCSFAMGISPLGSGSLVAMHPSLTIWIGSAIICLSGVVFILWGRKQPVAVESN